MFSLAPCSEAVTAVALTHDDAVVYSVGKDGAIIRLDVESGARWVPCIALND